MWIDMHVHLRDFKESNKETILHGLEVAGHSGLDGVFDMPNTIPSIITRKLAIQKLEIAKKAVFPRIYPVFYGVYMGLTTDKDQIKEAVETYKEFFPRRFPRKAHENLGVIGLKLYTIYSGGDKELAINELEAQEFVYETLVNSGYQGVLVVHCEKESELKKELWDPGEPISHSYARPEKAEIESIKDQINSVRKIGFRGHLHIAHVSVPESIEIIRNAKSDLNISSGVTPHHLLLNYEIMKTEDGIMYKCNPPLRSPNSQEQLLEQFKDDKIDVLESDHAPHIFEDKTRYYKSGIPNLASWADFTEILKQKGVSQELLDRVAFKNVNEIFGLQISRLKSPDKRYIEDYVFDPYVPLKIKLRKWIQ